MTPNIFKQRYIHIDVWQSWLNGMRFYYENNKIKEKWNEELRSGSYYGFDKQKQLADHYTNNVSGVGNKWGIKQPFSNKKASSKRGLSY
jgi:hypothetical protein